MCIIIVNKYGTLDKETMQRCATANPDGAGIMYSDGNNLIILKSLKGAEIIDKYYELRNEQHHKGNICLHFRIATDGLINIDNCHPYTVSKKVALMHNGILSHFSGWKGKDSDTALFIKHTLKGAFSDRQLMSEQMSYLLELSIGFGNKFALMNNSGEVVIINSSKGEWNKDKTTWYSNSTYKAYTYVNQIYTNRTSNNIFVDKDKIYSECWFAGSIWSGKTLRYEKTATKEEIEKYKKNKPAKTKNLIGFRAKPTETKYNSTLPYNKCTRCGKTIYSAYEIQEGHCYSCISLDYQDNYYNWRD
jgi:predicted glutamine amidotransferase